IDVALASGADGVQLGRDAVPVDAARNVARRAGRRLRIGTSVHSAAEAAQAAADGADLVILGTIWGSASHPGRQGSGVALVAEAAAVCPVPVYAIGGVTPQRAAVALNAGAYGVAVLTGVWDKPDAAAEAMSFLEAMQVVS
ncbi:MAG TPA: thiamine phosphate synthase, partial [Longimicrobiales bacterium]